MDPRLTKSAEFAPEFTDILRVSNPLLQAKQTRSQAERDVQLLENRLRRLRIEAERSAKAIEQTRKKAAEILALKQRDEERKAAKMRIYEAVEQERQRRQERFQKQKEEAQAMRQALAAAMLQTRRAEAAESKRMSQEHDEALARFRELERRRAFLVRKNIRAQEMDALGRTQRARRAHESALAAEWEQRLAEEEARRRRAEEAAAALEAEEGELLEKLRAMQARQRAAYEELEGALRASAAGAGGGGAGGPRSPATAPSPGSRRADPDSPLARTQ